MNVTSDRLSSCNNGHDSHRFHECYGSQAGSSLSHYATLLGNVIKCFAFISKMAADSEKTPEVISF